jgi:hypothetical protein
MSCLLIFITIGIVHKQILPFQKVHPGPVQSCTFWKSTCTYADNNWGRSLRQPMNQFEPNEPSGSMNPSPNGLFGSWSSFHVVSSLTHMNLRQASSSQMVRTTRTFARQPTIMNLVHAPTTKDRRNLPCLGWKGYAVSSVAWSKLEITNHLSFLAGFGPKQLRLSQFGESPWDLNPTHLTRASAIWMSLNRLNQMNFVTNPKGKEFEPNERLGPMNPNPSELIKCANRSWTNMNLVRVRGLP